MADHRLARVAASVFICVGLFGGALAACSSKNATASCDGRSSCTITFTRTTDTAKINILGVPVTLVSADEESVTLDVAGKQVTIRNGASTTVAGITLRVDRVTSTEIVIKATRA